jgi:nitrite reductase/ring-hydroxylating ferredoxin subunit
MSVSKTLCQLTTIPDGGAATVHVESSTGGFELVLTRQGGHVAAFHNECPHAGRRLDWAPGQFLIENGLLVCAAHGATFRVESGQCAGGPCRGVGLRAVPVEVIDGEVRLP